MDSVIITKRSIILINRIITTSISSFIILLGCLSAIPITISLLQPDTWLGDLFANFYWQFAVYFLIICVFMLLFKKIIWACIFLVISITSYTFVFPYENYHVVTAHQGITPWTITTMNALTKNTNNNLLIDEITQTKSTIVVLQEVSPKLLSKLIQLKSQYPYSVSQKTRPYEYLTILSKYPLTQHKTLRVGIYHLPLLMVTVQLPKLTTHLIALHLDNPFTEQGFKARNSELHDLAIMLEKQKKPMIIAGDFNTSPWSFYMRKFIDKTDLYNAMKGLGYHVTWKHSISFIGISIDHVLLSNDFITINRHVGEYIGSDHYPLTIKMIPNEHT